MHISALFILTYLLDRTNSFPKVPSDNSTNVHNVAEASLSKKSTTPEPLPEFSYVVPFIYKLRFPAAAVCSGVAVTDKLVLSTASPIAMLPLHMHCALPGFPRLTDATRKNIENECIPLKNIILDGKWTATNNSSLNLAMVQLERPIRFSWYVSTGRFIYPSKPENVTISNLCTLIGWKYRLAYNAPGFPLKEVATQLVSSNVLINVEKEMFFPMLGTILYLCNADIGMPIVCDCIIIGLVSLEKMHGDMECKNYTHNPFVYLLGRAEQKFLKATVPNTVNV